jgi:hypothetical protein
MVCKYFLSLQVLSFNSAVQLLVWWNQVCLFLLPLMLVSYTKSSFPKIFQVLGLMFNFVFWMQRVQFLSSACGYPVFPKNFCWKDYLFPLHVLGALVENQLTTMPRFISGPSSPFHRSMCSFLYEFHTLLITRAL